MLAVLPKNIPPWSMMVSSMGNPTTRELAKILGVTERTVFNYAKADQAPRAALLALFWLTPWGRSALDSDRERLLQTLESLSNALKNENAALRTRITRLEAIGGFGAANEPVLVPELPPRQVVKAQLA